MPICDERSLGYSTIDDKKKKKKKDWSYLSYTGGANPRGGGGGELGLAFTTSKYLCINHGVFFSI